MLRTHVVFFLFGPSSDYNFYIIQSVHGRPASAPTYRRPRSAVKSKDQKTKSDKTDKIDGKLKDLTEKEKMERDKVIDNLLERTRTLVDGSDKDQVMCWTVRV